MGVFNTVFTLLISTGVFHCIAVLFGAHPLNQFWGSLLWAVLMSLLICVPVFAVLGFSSQQWTRVFLHSRFSRAMEKGVYYGCGATLVGAWVGAFPILLDWNRPWQVWPIPCCVGAIAIWTCHWLGFLTLHYYWPHLLAINRTPV